MRTFVVHYHKLHDRKTHMQKQLADNSIEGEFVEQYDRDTLNDSDLVIFSPHMREPSRRPYVAAFLSHLYCYKQDFDVALILEDDAVLAPGFSNTLVNYTSQLPEDWDMLFIGDACGFHIPDIVEGKNVYFKSREQTSWGGHGATRAAHSYLVTNKCARRIQEYAQRGVFHMIDHWLNHAIRALNLNVYWAEPTIVLPGSEVGAFERSLNNNFS